MFSSRITTRNQLALRRLSLFEQFFELNKSVQCLMDEYRLNFIRAKGSSASFAVPSVAVLLSSQKELSPTIWVQTAEEAEDFPIDVDLDLFSLNWHSKCSEKGENTLRKRTDGTVNEKGTDDNANSTQNGGHSDFRPFGILENQSVKAARKNIQKLLPILCDLANIRRQIISLEKEANDESNCFPTVVAEV